MLRSIWNKEKFVILGIPFVSVMLPLVKLFPEFDITFNEFLGYVLNSFMHTASIWLGANYIFFKISKNHPSYQESLKRVLLLVGAITIYTAFVVVILVYVTCWNYGMNVTWDLYLKDFKTSFLVTSMVSAVFEARFFFKNWKEAMLEAERLQKQNAISQYETLKAQVNPHFLFNSLNSLSSLIHIDLEKSERFIEEFAKVYRYLLDTMGQNVVSLEEELNFVDSYVFLQKIRFDKNLRINIDIDEIYLDHFISPASLQLLVENAVKHNIISHASPLTVRVFIDNQFLVVENNIQLRKDRSDSTGMGQKNLIVKYQYISNQLPSFEQTETTYLARIPLISGKAE